MKIALAMGQPQEAAANAHKPNARPSRAESMKTTQDLGLSRNEWLLFHGT
jgi:hypothetical protein